METPTFLAPRKILPQLALISTIAYILFFLVLGGRIGPAVASFALIPVLLIGRAFGVSAGVVAGVISLPLNTLLFNAIGFPGIDIVFRVGGGPGTLMLVFVGGAAGLVHRLTDQLARQISTLQSTQDALQIREKDYHNLFAGMPIGIYRTTPDGQFLAANPAMLALLGFQDEQDILSQDVLQFFPDPGERKKSLEILDKNRVVHGVEFQLRRRDGSLLWVEDHARAVYGRDGQLEYYEGSLIDISQRKNAEALLSESETKYRELFDHIPQKIFYKNTDLVYVKVNPSYAAGANMMPEEVVGKTDYDLYPPEIAEMYRRKDRRVIETGNPEEFDEDTVENGKLLSIHTIKVPFRDPQGAVIGILGIYWDITERKRVEAALITSQVQLSNAVRIAHLGPWEYDLTTDQFTFTDAFYALLHTTAEREGGYSMSSSEYTRRFVYPGDSAVVGEEVRKALETTDPDYSREAEHRIVYSDGGVGFISVRFMIVKDEAGRTIKAFGTNQDITERKRAEAAREALLVENRRQKELLERIIQETPAGIAFLEGPDYRYTLANPGYLEFVHGKGEILGRTVAQVWPEAIDVLQPLLDGVYQTGKAFHGIDMPITMNRSRGPETAYFTFTYTPLIGASGSVESILVTAQETTDQIQSRQLLEKELADRKRIEAELRESEQRYVGLFEESPVSLWEEDFSEVKVYIDALKRDGVSDLAAYVDEHPEIIPACLSRIRVVDVNQEAVHMFGAESKADLLSNFDKIFPVESHAIVHQELLAIMKGQRIFESEGKNSTLSGQVIDIYLRWSVAPGCEETLARVFVSILDISSRKKAEALADKQAAQAELLAGIANSLSASGLDADAIYEIITAQTVSLIGDACLLTLVSDDHRWVKVAAFRHSNPDQLALMQPIFQDVSTPSGEEHESQVARTGKPIIIPLLQRDEARVIQEPGYREYLDRVEVDSLLVIPLVAQGKVIGTLGVLRDHPGSSYTLEDLSLLRYLANQASLPILNAQLHEQITRQAHFDSLTGVPNRRHFFESAEQEFQRALRYRHDLGVIMIDVDHFKEINDTYGHDVGDQMLMWVAERCRACIRSTDLLGRYGGDEFLILLPETDPTGAETLAERVRDCIASSQVVLEGKSIQVTVSLGVAMKADATPDLIHLLRCADKALYSAKNGGRNQVKMFEVNLD